MDMGIETRGQIDFWTDRPVETLSDLLRFVLSHATAPDITPNELLNARRVSPDDIFDGDDLPEICEFTVADAHFLMGVISYALEDPDNRGGLVVMEPDHRDGTTYIEIHFPVHMEPPAELR